MCMYGCEYPIGKGVERCSAICVNRWSPSKCYKAELLTVTGECRTEAVDGDVQCRVVFGNEDTLGL